MNNHTNRYVAKQLSPTLPPIAIDKTMVAYTIERLLAIIGFFSIVFMIYMLGFSKGIDHKEEAKTKTSIEKRLSNLEDKISNG